MVNAGVWYMARDPRDPGVADHARLRRRVRALPRAAHRLGRERHRLAAALPVPHGSRLREVRAMLPERLSLRPSEYVRRQVWATFQDDPIGPRTYGHLRQPTTTCGRRTSRTPTRPSPSRTPGSTRTSRAYPTRSGTRSCTRTRSSCTGWSSNSRHGRGARVAPARSRLLSRGALGRLSRAAPALAGALACRRRLLGALALGRHPLGVEPTRSLLEPPGHHDPRCRRDRTRRSRSDALHRPTAPPRAAQADPRLLRAAPNPLRSSRASARSRARWSILCRVANRSSSWIA